jgi:glycosyltransferase involved in cell wall biosynthesis
LYCILKRAESKIITKRLYKIIAVSKNVKKELTDFLNINPEKITVIYNGINLARFNLHRNVGNKKKSLKYILGIPEENFVVTSVLWMTEGKRCDWLLQSSAILFAGVQNLTVLIVGGGPLLEHFKELSKKLHISENVIFTGPVTDTTPFIKVADVFVLPSQSEALSNVIIEAMGCGKPVIATRVGGIPEVVIDGKTGFLVPVGDLNALVKRITTLIENPEFAKKLGYKGRKRAERFFDVKDQVDMLMGIYDVAVSQNRAHKNPVLSFG